MAKIKTTAVDIHLAPVQDGPSVEDILRELGGRRGAILAALRDMVMSLPGVDERAVYDGFCQEWTPAYYVEGSKARRQLFHVHDFPSGLRGTIFVGVRTLQPVLLDAGPISPRMKIAIEETPGNRTKQVRVPLKTLKDAAAFCEMVRVKWEFEQGRIGR
ncbi:MAG: hypothetical protein IIC99_12170 [Chloroflexi bacterium]|nr:hypothetical protein [Chloroflexota bacterium]